ncbi:MAG: DUF3365 domain-containing protein [Gemmatimonadota bacterium]
MPRIVLHPLLLLPLLAVAIGCGTGAEIPESTRARVAAAGDSAAMTLVRTLGGKLNGQLASHGPAGAIEFCAGRARELTDSVSEALGPGWEVRRTTRRTRNPRNAPDSLEAVALEYFHAAEGRDSTPGSLVQRTPDGDYRYYMPLRLGSACLECHGPRDALDPAVRAVLDTRYPVDQATGYREGDLRGVVRVTIPGAAID